MGTLDQLKAKSTRRSDAQILSMERKFTLVPGTVSKDSFKGIGRQKLGRKLGRFTTAEKG